MINTIWLNDSIEITIWNSTSPDSYGLSSLFPGSKKLKSR